MRNFLKKVRNVGLALVVTAGLGCAHGTVSSNNSSIPQNIEARVGEYLRGESVLYAGMNSESSFSLCYGGYTTSTGINLYYPKSSKTISLGKDKFNVISVTPEEIILQPLK